MTELMPALTTLEFYAGLMTGALTAKTVQVVISKAIKARVGGDE